MEDWTCKLLMKGSMWNDLNISSIILCILSTLLDQMYFKNKRKLKWSKTKHILCCLWSLTCSLISQVRGHIIQFHHILCKTTVALKMTFSTNVMVLKAKLDPSFLSFLIKITVYNGLTILSLFFPVEQQQNFHSIYSIKLSNVSAAHSFTSQNRQQGSERLSCHSI